MSNFIDVSELAWSLLSGTTTEVDVREEYDGVALPTEPTPRGIEVVYKIPWETIDHGGTLNIEYTIQTGSLERFIKENTYVE